jgi:hypothetical protein
MALQVGIVGLPNSGKSTLFNALTRAGAPVASYPFSTVEPNVGVVLLPDERLEKLAKAAGCEKMVPASIRFVDIAGLVEGAHRGEGLGNQFLAHIREVDAIAHTVRCFSDPHVAHVAATIDPSRDIDIVNAELIMADLETVERRLGKVGKTAKSGDRESQRNYQVLEEARDALQKGKALRTIQLDPEERLYLQSLFPLTLKPVIYVANLGEEYLPDGGPYLQEVREKALEDGGEMVAFCAKLESEIEELDPEDLDEFLASFGVEELGLHKFITTCFRLLGLITFFTVESGECRAWPVAQGTPAARAAGKIHSDMEKGFIRAEILTFDQFLQYGSMHAAREAGALRLEGRDYPVKDGEVIRFRFST